MTTTEEQVSRSKQLIALSQARKLLEEAEHLLKVLPQGRGSTLDADMVDGLHAAEIIAKAVAEVSDKILKRMGRGGGGGGLTVHGNEHHTENYMSSPLSDDLELNFGKKIRYETSNGFADPVDGSADIAWDDSLWCLVFQSADGSYRVGLGTYEIYVDDTIWAVNDVLTIRAKASTGQIKMYNAAGEFCFETSLTKKGIEVDTIDELTIGQGVTIEGILLKDSSLSGIVNATLSGILATDQIDEKTAAAGVTVDGLLIKDGVIPDSANLNYYLRDGSRFFTGDANFGGSYDITRLVRLEFEDDVGLFRRSVERLGVMKVPGTDPADLDCRELFTDDISEYTLAAGVTIDGLLVKDSEIYCDVVNEKTAATGVTTDGVLLKDGGITASDDITISNDAKHIQWSDVGLYRDAAGQIRVSTAGGTGLRDINVRTIFASEKAYLNLGVFSSSTRYVRLGSSSSYWQMQKADATVLFEINSSGQVLMPNLPVADPHVADQLWNNGGVLTVSSG